MERILFGAAYYDEYMPEERLAKDIAMMVDAGINVVRIGESTWSTIEKQEGQFDFSSLDRVVDAMEKAEINVIVGTATYAIPTWLASRYPDVLALTDGGRNKYGPRQNMDIAHPAFRKHAERIIRRVVERYAERKIVIGFQADNETKHYRNFGDTLQRAFVAELKKEFGSLDALNEAFGLDYWSNRINAWEDFPKVDATINASLGCAYARFQRKLVTDYLAWQVAIIDEYKRDDQFVTHNFDFEWRGYSFGVQPEVDHEKAAAAFDVVGIDVYHPTQDALTGAEISFCGDIARSIKGKNYLVMETQAQGFPQWVPYPGQLRLQAFGHLASGANMVEYWHWHSIHNAIETYWKGLLSHDFLPNPTYEEAKAIGADLSRLGDHLIDLKKANRAAILVSNDALSAFDSFKHIFGGISYNDVVRRLYDALYRLNVEVDIVFPNTMNISAYSTLFVPVLYAAPDALLHELNDFTRGGGNVVYTFASGFGNEHSKVRHARQPGIIGNSCGIGYSQFTLGNGISLRGDPFAVGKENNHLEGWMELLEADTAEILATYDHPHWGAYAAVTINPYGKGMAAYIGCWPSRQLMEGMLRNLLVRLGHLEKADGISFPLIRKRGINRQNKTITYVLNYSASPTDFVNDEDGIELLSNSSVAKGQTIKLGAWDFKIIEGER